MSSRLKGGIYKSLTSPNFPTYIIIIIPLLNNLFRFSVILPELFWRIILFLFENPVEIGKVVKATLESYLSNGVGGVDQHPDGKTNADIEDIIHHRFSGTKLEKPAE